MSPFIFNFLVKQPILLLGWIFVAGTGYAQSNFIIELNRILGDRLLVDQFSPPVASRIYMYSNLGVYEAIHQVPVWEFLKGIKPVKWRKEGEFDPNYTAALCFVNTASKLIYSSAEFEKQCSPILERLSSALESKVVDQSKLLANELTEQLMNRANSDGYKRRLTFLRYSVSEKESAYKLTPPGYSDPVEPYWGTIKPLVIDSNMNYSELGPNPFSLDAQSAFQQELDEVYQMALRNTDSTLNIARHWDCNPIQMELTGHIMQFSFRMTPSQHWIMLLCDLSEEKKIPIKDLSVLLARLSVVCYDAFIDCWNLKYHFNAIRPVTVINTNISSGWRPAIETPAFPEYPSGHSQVSAAAAVVLSDYFGSDFSYTDKTQVTFQLPKVHFPNFRSAAIQAGESRILGGIHFRKAIVDGFSRGEKIGKLLLNKWNIKP
jgi:hypothetical protein